MTTIAMPSFSRRLLQTVRDEMAAEPVHEWHQQDLELCLNLLGKLREHAADQRRSLEDLLADGVEARSFTREHAGSLAVSDEQLTKVRQLVELLGRAQDSASENVADALRSLEREAKLLKEETQAFRDLLVEALSRASEPPRPVDWDRIRAAEEAHASGQTKVFTRR